jgi:hypothetical protein
MRAGFVAAGVSMGTGCLIAMEGEDVRGNGSTDWGLEENIGTWAFRF